MRVLLAVFLFVSIERISAQLLLQPQQNPEELAKSIMCLMSADTTGTSPAKCHGTPTGSAYFKFINATQPVRMFLNGTGSPYLGTGITNVLPAGQHFVIVVDGAGCRDTVHFRITEPSPIQVSASTTNARCFNEPSGRGTASASGGTTPYVFQWEPCNGGSITNGSTVTNLLAGCYNVTATDGQGCKNSTQVTVGQPTQITFTSTVDSVTCFKSTDGRASVTVSGGTPGYTYLWDNGQFTPQAQGLSARFHYVTITDAAGCRTIAEVNVPGPERITLDSVSVVNPKCFGASTGRATAYVSGAFGAPTFFWSAGNASGNQVSGLSSGIYQVTVADAKNCRDSVGFILNSPPQLTAAVQAVGAEKCAGACNGTARINATGGTLPYSYNWGVPSIPSTMNQPTTLCAGQYTVTVSDQNSCSITRTLTISPGTDISVVFNGTRPTCANSTNGSIQATAFGGTQPFSYRWASGQTSNNLSGIGCGNFTLITTDVNNCKDTATYTLACPPPVIIDSIAVTNYTCYNSTSLGTLRGYARGGTGNLTYSWGQGAGVLFSGATANNVAIGTYTLTVTDANNCPTTSTATVTRPAQITGTTSVENIKCHGDATGSASVVASGGTGLLSYSWSNQQTQASISNLVAGTYTVTVTDSRGCTHIPTAIQVQQPAPLTLQVLPINRPCYGASNGRLEAKASGGTGNFTYRWNQPNSTQTILSGVGAGSYSVTVTDANQCTASANAVLSQYDSISVTLSVVNASCNGQSNGSASISQLTGGAGAGQMTNYQFNWSNGSPVTNSTQISNLAANTYSLTVTDQGGCSKVESFVVTSSPAIVPFITARNLTCFGAGNGEIVIDSIQSAKPITNVRWSNGSTNPSLITNLAAGTYTLEVTDADGCTVQLSTVITQPTRLTIDSLKGTSPTCDSYSDGSVRVKGSGGILPYTFSWSNGLTTQPTQSAQISDLLQQPVGTYNITITDANGCTISDAVNIPEPKLLTFTPSVADVSCYGASDGFIRLVIQSGVPPYKYLINGDSTSRSPYFNNLNIGDYTVVVTDARGCTNSGSFTITQPDKIVIGLGDDKSVVYGQSVEINSDVKNAVGIPQYKWRSFTSSDTIKCSANDCSSIVARPLFSSMYELVVEDENGCVGKAVVRVKVETIRGVFVPTAFTPNEDGENDLLMVFAKTEMIKQINVLRVFDRFGTLVYEQRDITPNDRTVGWDGTYRGKPVDPGVLVYYLEAEYIDGYKESLSGNVTLIR